MPCPLYLPSDWKLGFLGEARACQIAGPEFMALRQLSRGFRLRAASVLVVVYALCILAPAAAFAFGDGTNAAHCLTEENHGLGLHADSKAHVHHDGTAHQHSDDGDGQQSTSGKCCGLFCLSTLVPSAEQPLAPLDPMAPVPSLNAIGLIATGPDSLYRPPDSLLSL